MWFIFVVYVDYLVPYLFKGFVTTNHFINSFMRTNITALPTCADSSITHMKFAHNVEHGLMIKVFPLFVITQPHSNLRISFMLCLLALSRFPFFWVANYRYCIVEILLLDKDVPFCCVLSDI